MFKRVLVIILLLVLLGLGIVIGMTDTKPKSRDEVLAYSHQLFEYGSIRFVHDRTQNDPLFDRVRMGEKLDSVESCAYRIEYTNILAKNARIFGTLDQNIHFEVDHGMNLENNCAQLGIKGRHDLHDISARNNFEDIEKHLNGLSAAAWFSHIIAINDVNKDLVDLMVHYAPATHALGIHDPSFALSGEVDGLGDIYQKMVANFKTAQFLDVNSCEYWKAVDAGIENYVDIVMMTQEDLTLNTTWIERKIAGSWLALQTISPRLDIADPLRPRPQACLN